MQSRRLDRPKKKNRPLIDMWGVKSYVCIGVGTNLIIQRGLGVRGKPSRLKAGNHSGFIFRSALFDFPVASFSSIN